jgi:hypothetical protein
MLERSGDAPAHPPHHAVQFYGSDRSLYRSVAGFLSEGLVDGQPAVIVATPTHAAGILQRLSDQLVDVERARARGDLVVLDAQETLGRLMAGGVPSASTFEVQIGGMIDSLLRGRERTVVRAYGEMVDVLWKQGLADAAIYLEVLWNRLAQAKRSSFSLLCGYCMGNFYKQAEKFEEVCSQHTHVMGPDTNVLPFPNRRAAN